MKSLLVISTVISIILVVIYIMLLSIDNNIVSTNYSSLMNNKVKFIIPQGWAFFTRNPREDQVIIYKQMEKC